MGSDLTYPSSLDDLLANDKAHTDPLPAHPGVDADTYLNARAATLDAALLSAAEGLAAREPMLFAGGRLRFPKDKEDGVQDDNAAVIGTLYRMMPHVRTPIFSIRSICGRALRSILHMSRRACRQPICGRSWRP